MASTRRTKTPAAEKPAKPARAKAAAAEKPAKPARAKAAAAKPDKPAAKPSRAAAAKPPRSVAASHGQATGYQLDTSDIPPDGKHLTKTPDALLALAQ